MKMIDWTIDAKSREITYRVEQDYYDHDQMHVLFMRGNVTLWELRMTKVEYAAFITALDSVTMR